MDTNPNILLIRLKSIGDILFLLPAVHRIRENFPDAKITFLTSKKMRHCWRVFGRWTKSSHSAVRVLKVEIRSVF